MAKKPEITADSMREAWSGVDETMMPIAMTEAVLALIRETGDISKASLIEHFEQAAASDEKLMGIPMSEISRRALEQIEAAASRK